MSSCVSFLSFFVSLYCFSVFFFFFQAEDGIRDGTVTGVQTCALPICSLGSSTRDNPQDPGPCLHARDSARCFISSDAASVVLGVRSRCTWFVISAYARDRKSVV